MEKLNKKEQKSKDSGSKKKMSIKWRNGSYSAGIIVAMIAIVLVINLIAEKLPSNIKQIDISTNQIYSIGDTTKAVLDDLEEDVKIVILAEENYIDHRIEQLIDNYAAASKHITKEVIDPVLHPSALTEYNTTANNVIVSCEETGKQRVIAFGEMIVYDQMAYYYYGQYQETEFDGEGQITSAISYVSTESENKIYTLEGHGESSFSDTITDLIDKGNIELGSVNLLTDGAIPEDCGLLVIYAATSDLANDERDMLLSYLKDGGKMMILIGTDGTKLPNLEAVMSEYGIELADGYIADTQRFYQNSYYNIFPVFDTSNEICSGFTSDSLALVINARGMTVQEDLRDGLIVEGFMETSSDGYAVTSNENRTQGTYLLGAVATETVKEEQATPADATEADAADSDTSDKETRLTVISASTLIEQQITDAFPSLVNTDVFMNAVTANFDEVENISIPAKSLEITYNTVKNANTWGLLFVAVIPIGLIVIGLIIWIRRKRA